jgi:hypothetical protein
MIENHEILPIKYYDRYLFIDNVNDKYLFYHYVKRDKCIRKKMTKKKMREYILDIDRDLTDEESTVLWLVQKPIKIKIYEERNK